MVKILEFKGTDTIPYIRSEILKVISKREDADVQKHDIVLFHRPKECSKTFNELDCDTSILNDYQITPYDKLMYIRYNFEENEHADIQYEGRQPRLYHVKSQETVISLKLKIQDQFGVPVGKQKLTIPGMKELNYNKKIPNLRNIRLELVD